MPGHFSSHRLAEIFRDLYLGERSGVLHLERDGVEKRIYFDRGMILYAESSAEDEDLGRRLVSEGKISSGALAEARRSISEPKDLAQALVNRGLIGKETLSHTVRFIVERVVQLVFKWEGGSAKFNEGWLLQEIFESDILSTFEVILKGIDGMVGFDPIRETLRGLDTRLRIRVPPPVPLERLALSPAHGFILSRVDGTSSLNDILSILPQGEEDLACRFLYGLLVMGVVAHDPPVGEGPFRLATVLRDHADGVALETLQEKAILQAYGNLKDKTPYQILGVAPTASRESIESAYHETKEQFGRDRLLPKVREKLRSELAVIDSRLVEAFLTLCQARSGDSVSRREDTTAQETSQAVGVSSLLVRVEMDKTHAKKVIEENAKVADSYFSKARKYMREADYHNAIQYAKLAVSYCPEDARFYFLMGECQVRNPEPRWQRMAEQNYVKATELDPWSADYRVSLGRFYKRRGLKLRARKQFEQALETVPSHEAATKELESLG
jgi:tetratricopeptide (TPR) repeat protein